MGEVVSGITAQKKLVLLRERKEDYQVWLEPDFLHIEDLRVNIYNGYYYKFDRKSGIYEVDHQVYYFFQSRTGRLVYSECGSSLEVCITNYANEVKKDIGIVEDLLCTYELDNGKFICKKILTRDKL